MSRCHTVLPAIGLVKPIAGASSRERTVRGLTLSVDLSLAELTQLLCGTNVVLMWYYCGTIVLLNRWIGL